MNREELLRKVKAVIARVLKVNESEIGDEANLVFDLGADSRQSLELIAGFEEEFDIQLEEEGAMEVQTVSGAVDFISRYTD
jgi:acyl carrier protein